VSSIWTLLSPLWWYHYSEAWAFYVLGFIWETTAWRVCQAHVSLLERLLHSHLAFYLCTYVVE